MANWAFSARAIWSNSRLAPQGAARLILAAAAPLHEPVARWGPFVMNTPQEIQQALADYRDGRL